MGYRKSLKQISCMFLAAAMVCTELPHTAVNAAEIKVDGKSDVVREEEQPFGKNVARGKNVYVIDQSADDAEAVAKITDGNTADGFQFTDRTWKDDWVLVDLGQEYVINRLDIYQEALGGTYQMYVADGTNVLDTDALKNPLEDEKVQWKTIDENVYGEAEHDKYLFPQKKVRYILYQSKTHPSGYGIDLQEIEAYTVGTTETAKISGKNIASNAKVYAPKNDKQDEDGNITDEAQPAANMVDGDETTYWISYGPGVDDSWFIIDLGEDPAEYDTVWLQSHDRYGEDYTISVADEVSSTNKVVESDWTKAYEIQGAAGKYQECVLDQVHTERYLLFQASKVYYETQCSFSEVGVLKAEDIIAENLYLDCDQITLNLSDEDQKTRKLQYAVNPDNAKEQELVWTSSDPDSVEVSEDGIVTAKKKTDKPVTVTAAVKGSDVTASCDVTVIRESIEAPSNVKAALKEDESSIEINWDAVDNAKAYEIYRSKDGDDYEKLASVKGSITKYSDAEAAAVPGTYTYKIRVIAGSGAKADSDASEEVKILPEVTEIGLNKTKLTMRVDGTAQLTVTPVSAVDVKPYDLTWSVDEDGQDIVTVDETGLVTAKAAGKTTVTATVEGKPELTAECSITVKEAVAKYDPAPLPEDHVLGKNVALNKNVTLLVGNDKGKNDNEDKSALVDGNFGTLYTIEPDGTKDDWKQYYIIDLGKDYVIDRTRVCWRDDRFPSEYQIEVAEAAGGKMPKADDTDAWTVVAADDDYQLKENQEIKEDTFVRINARYVKINCIKAGGSNFFDPYEIEVYTAGKKNVEGNLGDNLALAGEIVASPETETEKPKENLIDGDPATNWRPVTADQYFILDLGAEKTFNLIKLTPDTTDRWAKHYQLFAANELTKNPTTGEYTIGTKENLIYEETSADNSEQYCVMAKDVTARYIMFKSLENNASDDYKIELGEIEVYDVTGAETRGISVSPGTLTLSEKENKLTGQLTAVVDPVTADKRTVVYQSNDEKIVTVDPATGEVTAVNPGKTTITATVEGTGISAEIPVYVYKSIEKVSNLEAELTNKTSHDVTVTWDALETAESYELIRILDGQKTTVTVINADEAKADKNGKITFTDKDLKAGTYKYKITADPKEQEYASASSTDPSNTVIVPEDLTGITLRDVTVNIGEKMTLTAVFTPENATYQDVKFSTTDTDNVISLNEETGEIEGRKEGTADITVTSVDYPDIKADCTVTVKKIPVTGIMFASAADSVETTLGLGEELTLLAQVLPENATCQDVSWKSSAPEIAEVDEKGKVTAKAVGTVTITVTSAEDETVTDTCKINVIQKSVESIRLDVNEKVLCTGDTFILTATVLPETAENKKVAWTSSDPAVVSVDENGKVTAVKDGRAVITAATEDGNKTAVCEVTVTKPAAATVILSETSVNMTVGDVKNLTAATAPETADQTISWSSSNPSVATVDENGKVTAIADGTAVITAAAKEGNVTGTCTVTVSKPAVTGILLNTTAETVTAGSTVKLSAIIAPKDADQTVLWSSSNPAVASVDADGTVTALQAGSAAITAAAGNVTAVCQITVKAAQVKVTAPAKTKLISAKKSGKSSAVLKWKKVKGAAGYEVYMKTGKKGWKKVKTIKNGNTVKYTQKKLKSGTTYQFKVRAYKKAGSVTKNGKYSNVKKLKF